MSVLTSSICNFGLSLLSGFLFILKQLSVVFFHLFSLFLCVLLKNRSVDYWLMWSVFVHMCSFMFFNYLLLRVWLGVNKTVILSYYLLLHVSDLTFKHLSTVVLTIKTYIYPFLLSFLCTYFSMSIVTINKTIFHFWFHVYTSVICSRVS